jgi:hypothetical protein
MTDRDPIDHFAEAVSAIHDPVARFAEAVSTVSPTRLRGTAAIRSSTCGSWME